MVEQVGQDSAIARALQRIGRRCVEQGAGLRVADRGVDPSLPFAIGRLTPSTSRIEIGGPKNRGIRQTGSYVNYHNVWLARPGLV